MWKFTRKLSLNVYTQDITAPVTFFFKSYTRTHTHTHTLVLESVVGTVYCQTPSSFVCPKETFYILQVWHSLKSMRVCCDTADQHMQFVRNRCHAVCTVSSYIRQLCPKLNSWQTARTHRRRQEILKIFYDMSARKKKKKEVNLTLFSPHLDKQDV